MQGLVDQLANILTTRNMMIVTAESCTGGQVASAITQKSGASAYFDRGFITYSNEAKQEQIGVPSAIIEKHGAVSSETAKAMAKGALKNSKASIALSVTGIAGPDGGSPEKPVGTVHFGFAIKGGANTTKYNVFSGSREEIQKQATAYALKAAIDIVGM